MVLVYVVLFAIFFSETGLVFMTFLPGDSLLFVAGAVCALPRRRPGPARLPADGGDHGRRDPRQHAATTTSAPGSARKVYDGTHRAGSTRCALDRRRTTFYETPRRQDGRSIARFVPIVRTLRAAGGRRLGHGRTHKFQLFNVPGAVLWVGVAGRTAATCSATCRSVRDNLGIILVRRHRRRARAAGVLAGAAKSGWAAPQAAGAAHGRLGRGSRPVRLRQTPSPHSASAAAPAGGFFCEVALDAGRASRAASCCW
ncbi:MAG: hypothetical protein MZW92_35245 [Comamonadaceae bacterium]|nr:hypothetical protein [Comamonadaceae bacterium]